MPFSSDSGKPLVDRAVLRLTKHPDFFTTHKVLDLGTGSGTYSDRYSKSLLPRSKFHWTGVEIWEPYIQQYGLLEKYDTLFNHDVRGFFMSWANWMNGDTSKPGYDICFTGDILEHMTQAEAIQLVKELLIMCKVVIISIPIGHYPQPEYQGNPYEAHVKNDWSHEDVMSSFPNVVFWGIEKEIGVYVLQGNHGDSEFLSLQRVLAPKIGVYAICKNETEFIERMYQSIAQADNIEICDTGSTDDTWLRLSEFHHTDQISAHRITVAPWRFDDARNVALSLLPEELDICISIDADEVMQEGWYELLCEEVLKDFHEQGRVFDRYHHRFSTIWNWREVEQGGTVSASEHWHERIHARKGYIWKLPVHEVLVKSDLSSEQVKWLGSIWMIQKPDRTKSRPYLTLIEQAIVEDPKRWKLHAFYASDLIEAGRIDDGIAAINKALLIIDADHPHLHNQLARAHQAKKDIPAAINEMTTAACMNAGSREYKVYVAQLYMMIGNKSSAWMWMQMAQAITEQPSGYSYDPSCWGDSFEAQLNSMRIVA